MNFVSRVGKSAYTRTEICWPLTLALSTLRYSPAAAIGGPLHRPKDDPLAFVELADANEEPERFACSLKTAFRPSNDERLIQRTAKEYRMNPSTYVKIFARIEHGKTINGDLSTGGDHRVSGMCVLDRAKQTGHLLSQ